MSKITSYNSSQIVEAIRGNTGLLFVHFASALASSCDVLRRELESSAPLFAGVVDFAEVEVSLSDMELIHAHRLEQIPTLVLYRGSEEVERLDALLGLEDLQQFLHDSVSYYLAERASDGGKKS